MPPPYVPYIFDSPMVTPIQHVFQPIQPWTWSPANYAALGTSLSTQPDALLPHCQKAQKAPLGKPPTGKQHRAVARSATSAKAGKQERLYSEQDMRDMVAATLRRDKPSADRVCEDAGFPSARSSLYAYVKEIRADLTLRRDTPELTLAAQLAHTSVMQLKVKGNADFLLRRIFSADELEFFARSLKLYGDMGWPMDTKQIQIMMSQAASKKGMVDWKRGQPPAVSATYVRDFIKHHPELKSLKTSHVDPLRTKKATHQVPGLLAYEVEQEHVMCEYVWMRLVPCLKIHTLNLFLSHLSVPS